jgi:hypothetical protein
MRNFENWKNNRFPNPPKGFNVWEYYCVEQFARSYDLSDSELKSGIVGAGLDGGVDAFYILANGEPVDAESEINPKQPPEFQLLIMQVKSNEGFSPVAVDKLFWFTDDLLDLSKGKADYHSTYHPELIALMRLFKDKFGLVVGETPKISIEFVYSIKKDVQPNEDCLKAGKRVVEKCSHFFQQAQTKFQFVNAAQLWKQVQARPLRKKTLVWAAQPMSTQEGEIGLVRLTDYFDFIREMDGKIAERFFDSNVRGYWPHSGINKSIGETLKSQASPEFWLLNNGVTILTQKIETASGFLAVDIHDPQIVNGLQTSRQIFNHFTAYPVPISSPTTIDNRRLLIRIIKTSDTEVRDAVIRCTNSQNEMPDESLRATDAIHRQLETAFHLKKLYYDRRKGHYRDQGKPVDQIVSIIEVLQAMLSIVLQRPDDARGRPRNYIKNTKQYGLVFGPDIYQLTLYIKATEICRRIEAFLEAKKLEAIHRRNVNFYLAMYSACAAIKSAYAITDKLQQIDIPKVITDAFLEGCYSRVWKLYERVAEKLKSADGERDYDSAAKGSELLKAMQTELKKKFK